MSEEEDKSIEHLKDVLKISAGHEIDLALTQSGLTSVEELVENFSPEEAGEITYFKTGFEDSDIPLTKLSKQRLANVIRWWLSENTVNEDDGSPIEPRIAYDAWINLTNRQFRSWFLVYAEQPHESRFCRRQRTGKHSNESSCTTSD